MVEKLKAFSVLDSDGNGTVVFATTPAQAKALGHHSGDCLDCDWTELRVTREPRLDDIAKKAGLFDFGSHQKEYRSIGWHVEGSNKECIECGLCCFPDIPESYINEDGICEECQEQDKADKAGKGEG